MALPWTHHGAVGFIGNISEIRVTLRRKIIFKDLVLLASLLMMIAAALWGFYRQRVHVNAALSEYAALKHVEQAEVHLVAFQRAVHAGEMNRPASITELRAALTAMSQYKAILSQYESVLPPEITPDMQDKAKALTKTLVADLVQMTLQLDPTKNHPGLSSPPVDIPATTDRASEQLVQLLSMCNGFVNRTGLESASNLHTAIVVVAAIAACMLVVALTGSLWEYRNVIVPLRGLRQWSKRTAAGDFSARFAPTADGEFQELGRDINQMADELSGFYRKLEEMVARKSRELVRAERLASVGYLAAGVAHEINNPLNIISGYAELGLKHLRLTGVDADDAVIAEQLAIIRSEAFRCKEITTRLLSLARGSGEGREIVSLRDAVASVADLVRGLKIFRRRTLRVEIDEAQPLAVKANLTEMKQVLLNLVVNAIEAVSKGGEVTVTGRIAAGWVEVTVADNGRGMSSETLERVFEPFFTNKRGAGDPGTGLGLSISFAILASHGGEIHAQSDGPGQGSRFTVRLPAAPLNARILSLESIPEAPEVVA